MVAVMVARDSVSDAVAVTAAVLATCSVATAAVAQCHHSCHSAFRCPGNRN